MTEALHREIQPPGASVTPPQRSVRLMFFALNHLFIAARPLDAYLRLLDGSGARSAERHDDSSHNPLVEALAGRSPLGARPR